MMTLLIYTLLSAALFFLGSRALITQPLWSRYPAPVAKLMDCAACTGFWWGLVTHLIIGRSFRLDVGPLPAMHPATPLLVGLCLIALTPITAALMQWGLDYVGVPRPANLDAGDHDS
jgi:hypothetical protein